MIFDRAAPLCTRNWTFSQVNEMTPHLQKRYISQSKVHKSRPRQTLTLICARVMGTGTAATVLDTGADAGFSARKLRGAGRCGAAETPVAFVTGAFSEDPVRRMTGTSLAPLGPAAASPRPRRGTLAGAPEAPLAAEPFACRPLVLGPASPADGSLPLTLRLLMLCIALCIALCSMTAPPGFASESCAVRSTCTDMPKSEAASGKD